MDLLLPLDRHAQPIPDDPGERLLLELYAHPEGSDGAAYLRSNMVTTLDGAATGADERSGSINDDADHRVFEVVRALADVVLIGAGTARAEGYGALAVAPRLAPARAALGRAPGIELAVITASGVVPAHLTHEGSSAIVVTHADCPRLGELRSTLPRDRLVVLGRGQVDLAGVLGHLAERGLPRILNEGGPRLLADLLAAELVDDLCLTTTPQLVGGPARRPTDSAAWFAPAVHARPAHLLHEGGTLLGRWLVREHPASGSALGSDA